VTCAPLVEEPTLGCGERNFVVTGIGPERVRLFSCAPLVEIEVARRQFDERAEDYESDPPTVLAILRRNAASASRHRLEFDKQAAAVAESLLAAESPEVGDPWCLCAGLQQFSRTHSRTAAMASSLQLASAPWQYRRQAANQPPRPGRGQPPEAPQLATHAGFRRAPDDYPSPVAVPTDLPSPNPQEEKA